MVRLATHEWPPLPPTDAGAAAPVAVLVHGITGWWQTWWRVGPALARDGWHVIGVDLPGHGDSPPIRGTTTRLADATDLGATIEALGVAPVDALIGHSLGAAVAIELARRRPELARRLVLEDPPGTDRSGDLPFQVQLEREVQAARARPEQEVARLLAENPAWLEEDARNAVEGLRRCDISGISASLRHGMGSRVVDQAPKLSVPALYLLAEPDRSAIRGEQRSQLLDGIPPGSRSVELDCGHAIHRDRFETYVSMVHDWLGGAA